MLNIFQVYQSFLKVFYSGFFSIGFLSSYLCHIVQDFLVVPWNLILGKSKIHKLFLSSIYKLNFKQILFCSKCLELINCTNSHSKIHLFYTQTNIICERAARTIFETDRWWQSKIDIHKTSGEMYRIYFFFTFKIDR